MKELKIESPPTSSPKENIRSPTKKVTPIKQMNLFMIPETNENTPKVIEEAKESRPPGLEKGFKTFQAQKSLFVNNSKNVNFRNEAGVKSAFISKSPGKDSHSALMEILSAGITTFMDSPGVKSIMEDSRVLHIKGITKKDISVKHIYNLFSNFGDIKRIILLRAKEAALVEFETLEFAKLAKDNLNNLFFFDEYMKISFSNYKEIIPKNLSKNSQNEDLMICEKKHSRFNSDKSININNPSNVLHLSNLDKNCTKEELIIEFFKDIAEVEGMK